MPTINQLVRKGRASETTEEQVAGLAGLPPASRRVHPRVHHDAEEAELGTA